MNRRIENKTIFRLSKQSFQLEDRVNTGFTIIELMVTIAIAAILVAIAIPSFSGLIQRNATASDANEFITYLNLARSEAIKRNRTVNVVAKTGGWVNGFTVEISTAPNPPLRDFIPSEQNVTITSNPTTVTTVSFLSNGLITSGSAATFNLCRTAGAAGKSVVIGNTGRVSVVDIPGTSCT